MYGIIVISLVLVLLTWVILYPIVVYFLDVKGLRRYPTISFLAGVTNIPYMILSAGGSRSKRLAELHKRHPVLRIGPNALSFGDGRAIKDIYGHSTKCIKDDMYRLLAGSHSHLADVVDKKEHQRKRKILSSAYALKNLEGWEYKIVDKVSKLCGRFDRCCPVTGEGGGDGDIIDWRAWTNFFTMDAIADIGLNSSLGFLEQGDDMTISESLDGVTRLVSYRDCLHSQITAQSQLVWTYGWYKSLVRWSRRLPTRYRELFSRGDGYDGIVIHQVRKRLQQYQEGKRLEDFFQALMESKDGSPNYLPFGEIGAEISIMQRRRLKDLCLVLVNAGSISTAVAINNAMYMLLKHPGVLARLREEVDIVADDDEVSIPYDKVKNLPYLRACLDESMRILPPTPFNLPRKTPPEGCEILSQWVPGNTTVSMSSYVAHRDEKVFSDPEVFRPERWLGERGKELQPYFITFSAGARGCIGRNISYLEQTILIASTIHRYDLELVDPSMEQTSYEHLNMNPGPLPVKGDIKPVIVAELDIFDVIEEQEASLVPPVTMQTSNVLVKERRYFI
ncbi:cytochrome P450 [Aspergillus sclerotioniger CBS 115572]|uniref:Cytochrome P450 n=1 Tax=Aspergillus sclerotioniger CBS 115572 TaxID=1450535 RepID=A0A317X605_9EURO|nr:cytochrome P450 [Aspergillus sclerotioniger CBS 115572]PWY94046.1 cytochrome P450 [Aspergillus sclerotioniger CBS 115572]